jgi:hypothetical protein
VPRRAPSGSATSPESCPDEVGHKMSRLTE